MASEFSATHLKQAVPDLTKAFDITCPPGTDLWDKPPATHSNNAPMIYKTTTKGALQSAKVTVSAEWKDKYDQGGLCVIIRSGGNTRWVKAGVEFVHEKPHVSVVAKDRWSDWSLRPLASASSSSATIELENASDGSLWVWLLADGQRLPLREVTWWGELDGKTECWVGPFAAKPAPHGEKDDLIVHFEDLAIKTV
ncbi:hypothetical protein RBB50_001115 [Rhinocladiella similis]